MRTLFSDIANFRTPLSSEDALRTGYPQLAMGAILTLNSLVDGRMKVLELGCGGSTYFWAKNCRSVKSYETDENWFKKVAQKLKGYRNAQILHVDRHRMSLGLKSEPNDSYDIVHVNSDPKRTRRADLVNLALPKLKSGGWLIVNNYQWSGMGSFNYKRMRVLTFDEIDYPGRGTRLARKA
jgi:predicted O-methyltransferase YrrM